MKLLFTTYGYSYLYSIFEVYVFSSIFCILKIKIEFKNIWRQWRQRHEDSENSDNDDESDDSDDNDDNDDSDTVDSDDYDDSDAVDSDTSYQSIKKKIDI